MALKYEAVIAINSFKESLSSIEVGNSVSEGIKRVFENVDVKVFLIADGGKCTDDDIYTIFKSFLLFGAAERT